MPHFDEKDLPLLRKYLMGLLSGTEKENLERKLQDPEGRREFEFYQALFRAVELAEDREIKEELQKEEAGAPTAAPRRLPRGWKWAAAAGLALVLALSLWLFLPKAPPSYFEPYPLISQSVDRGGPTLSPEENAFYWYSEHRYRRALRYFRELPANPANNFYQANALLALNRPAEAAALLFQVVAAEGSVYAEPAKFYLGLALFHDNRKAEARRWLNEALQSPAIAESYKVAARKMLEETGE